MGQPIEIYIAHDLATAYELRFVLEDAGIGVHIGNEHLVDGIGGLASGPTTNPSLLVDESEAERARELLEAHLAGRRDQGKS